MEFIGKVILFVIAVFIGFFIVIWGATVFYDVWGWFAVPMGAPALLNKWHGSGLLTIVSWPLLSLSLGVQDVKDILREGTDRPPFLQRVYTKLALSALSVALFWGFAAVYRYLMLTNAF